MSNPNPNWRPDWLERWGYIPPLATQPDPKLIAEQESQKLAEKEAHERVEKVLQIHADHLPEETKREIKAVMAEAQARIGFAPDSPELTLVPRKPQGISRLKFFLKNVVRAKPNGGDVTRTALSAQASILRPGTFLCTNETVETLVERALNDRTNVGIRADD